MTTRSTYPIGESARITTRRGGAQLVLAHPNWCLAAESGRIEDCTCNDSVWIILPAKTEVR